jgi:hypothetical protein
MANREALKPPSLAVVNLIHRGRRDMEVTVTY